MSDLKTKAKEAAAELAEVEQQLAKLNALDVFAKLEKQVADAVDPLAKMVAQQRLVLTGQKMASDEAAKAAKKEADAQKVIDKAIAKAGKTADEQAKTQIKAEKAKGDETEKAQKKRVRAFKESFVGGLIEEGAGKKILTAVAKVKEGMGSGAGRARLMVAGLSAIGSAATATAGALLKLGSAGVEGASLVGEMVSFRQNTEFAMKYALGSGAMAKDTLDTALRIAKTIGVSVKDIGPELQQMFSQGLGQVESEKLVHLVEDFKASGHADVGQKMIDAVAKIKHQGALTPDMIDALRSVGPGAKENVDKYLADKLGVKATGIEARTRAVNAALGKIRDPRQRMKLLEGASKATLGEGKVGEVAHEKAFTTIDGAIGRVKGNLDGLFAKMDTSEAGKKLLAGLNKVADALDPDTAAGQKLLETLNKIGTVFDKTLGKIDVDATIDAILSVIDAVDELTNGFDPLKTALLVLNPLSYIMESSLGDAIGNLIVEVENFADEVFDAGYNAGNAIIDGIGGGIDAKEQWVVDKMKSLADKLPDAVRKLLGIHSPSRVFAQIGMHTAEGMAQGIDEGAPGVQRSTMAMIPIPSDAPSTSSAGGARGGMSVNLGGINIQVTATPGSDAQQMGQELGEQITKRIHEVFEQLAIEFGAAGPGS